MPVSTTHSCVGGMVEMTIALKGSNCVIWYKPVTTFPYVGGVSGIVLFGFLSPLFSAIFASLLFGLLRKYVLRHDFNTKRINWTYPLLIGGTMTINTFFIIYKGAKGLGLDKTPIEIVLPVVWNRYFLSSICIIPFVPKIKRLVENKFTNGDVELEDTNVEMTEQSKTYNIKDENELNRVISLHEDAEKFDKKTEYTFRYLQIFTAICDSFSHGANDVANAIGPFAAMWAIHNAQDLSKKNDMESDAYWILGLGGAGIALGLFLYGYRITHVIGTKLVKITPSRGVAIELSSVL